MLRSLILRRRGRSSSLHASSSPFSPAGGPTCPEPSAHLDRTIRTIRFCVILRLPLLSVALALGLALALALLGLALLGLALLGLALLGLALLGLALLGLLVGGTPRCLLNVIAEGGGSTCSGSSCASERGVVS